MPEEKAPEEEEHEEEKELEEPVPCLRRRSDRLQASDALAMQRHQGELAALLYDLALLERNVAPDGNCFFLALVDMLEQHKLHPEYDYTPSVVLDLPNQYAKAAAQARADVCNAMAPILARPAVLVDGTDDEYIRKIRLNKTYAGEVELQTAAVFFNVRVVNYAITPGGLTEYSYEPDGGAPRAVLRFCLRYSHFWATCET